MKAIDLKANHLIYCILAYLCLLLGQNVWGQEKGIIYIKNIKLNPAANAQQWLDSFYNSNATQPAQVLLQFGSLPNATQREQLIAAGIQVQDYIPDNTFIAIINPQHSGFLAAVSGVEAVVPVKASWKADNYIWQQANKHSATAIRVMVSVYKGISKSQLENYLPTVGAKIISGTMEAYDDYTIEISGSKLLALADWYGIKYINPLSANLLLDEDAKESAKVNLSAMSPQFGGNALLGDSMVVGIGDNASGAYHVDLADRVINYNQFGMTNHGIHINGIVGGAGIVDPNGEGTAYHATLVNHFFDNIIAYTPLMMQAHNMTITNNSYVELEGDCSYAGTYDNYAALIDAQCISYPDLLHVFAAGNDGLLVCTPYAQSWATTCGGYQPAKNNLCVTSTDLIYDLATTSRGPVKDGRIKPDICMVGVNVNSCIGTTDYLRASGSSMASPGVAGAAALLSQKYKQLHGNQNPRADILKTLLLNGAIDLGTEGPDYHYGFGFLNLDKAIKMLVNGQFDTGIAMQGSVVNKVINVPANTAQLKVMLNWNDVPGSPMAAKELVNDLDITLIGPDMVLHRPLVPNGLPQNVSKAAIEQEDHLNNTEQIIIDNPVAGSYTLSIKGYNVPSLSQPYVIAYDFIPKGIRLTSPVAGTRTSTMNTTYVFWDASKDSNTFSLQYSADSGVSWNIIENSLPDTEIGYRWYAPVHLNSGKMLLKLMRNNTADVSVSGPFAMSDISTLHADSIQCPGYFSFYWDSLPNASAYEVMRKIGPYMTVTDTVTTTHFVYSGLSRDSVCYVAVMPLLNGREGYRSFAIWRQPNWGTCAENYSAGDLALDSIVAPQSGRMYTSTQLGASENLVLRVHNLYTQSCSNYNISYQINNGVWQSSIVNTPIPADSAITISLPVGLNFLDTGIYVLRVAISNVQRQDPNPKNDTLSVQIKQLPNNPINLSVGFYDGFETMPAMHIVKNYTGLSSYWDYSCAGDSGRIRTFVNDSILISGNRSISMDAMLGLIKPVQNYFNGTFNLSNYTAAGTEVRCGFDYILHGVPDSVGGNQFWVRGSDTSAWIKMLDYDLSTYAGVLNHSGSLSLSDAMMKNVQQFSSSTQVRFGQLDTSLIALRNYGNGVTIDNFTLYTVSNDVALRGIVSPTSRDCGLSTNVPLTVLVGNGVNAVQHNILMYYTLDNGPVNVDTLAVLNPKDSILFTFKQKMNFALGQHSLNVWLSNAGDTYTANDSQLNYIFHNQPLVSNFPYLENFESGDGNYYTDGINDTWQYGTPASAKIYKAASGTHAWKTNLSGHYANMCAAYLYSPCFDISGLSNPMFSCSFAMQIENCGDILCDAGYIEYSYDGQSWTKLGSSDSGTNWYDSSFNVWNEEGNTRWHVVSIALPQSTVPIRLRFVLKSDEGTNFDGMAVDDIHIYNKEYPSYDGPSNYVILPQVQANVWNSFATGDGLFCQIEPTTNTLGVVNVTVYEQLIHENTDATQYLLPLSYTVKPTQSLSDSVGLRLFIRDSDVVNLLQYSDCMSCSKPEDAYSLAINEYSDVVKNNENGLLGDDIGGKWTFYPAKQIAWVPYDKGYYAEIKVSGFSEFWFSDGGPLGNTPIESSYMNFSALRIDAQHVETNWSSNIDSAISNYSLERSYNDSDFISIDSVSSVKLNNLNYRYTDTPHVNTGSVVYYRLRWLMASDSICYTPVKEVDWTAADLLLTIYPNPTNGLITIDWTSAYGAALIIKVTDILGKVVYENNVSADNWNMHTLIQTPHFQEGVYFFRFSIGENTFLRKIVYYK
jgi:hypothetical protein